MNEIVEKHFLGSIEAKTNALEHMANDIAIAGNDMVQCIQQGGKIFTCGNGGSAGDAQHFSAELLNRFEMDRRPLPSIALTTDTSTITSIGNDFSFDLIFAKQVAALTNDLDILLAISTSGNSANIIEAIKEAHNNNTKVIALTGKGGGKLVEHLNANDLHLCVPCNTTSRIQEVHITIIHCLCDIIDTTLFAKN